MLTPSYDLDRIRLRVLSLGAGVQSTTLALMAAHGEVTPMPDLAVFADTGWEPARVYEHLQWLSSDNVLPFPIHVVSAGNIREGLMRGARGERWASIPAFTRTVTPAGTRIVHYDEDADGEKRPVGQRVLERDEVAIGMITRQCTTEYKLEPIRRHVRVLAGLGGRRSPAYPVVVRGAPAARLSSSRCLLDTCHPAASSALVMLSTTATDRCWPPVQPNPIARWLLPSSTWAGNSSDRRSTVFSKNG